MQDIVSCSCIYRLNKVSGAYNRQIGSQTRHESTHWNMRMNMMESRCRVVQCNPDIKYLNSNVNSRMTTYIWSLHCVIYFATMKAWHIWLLVGLLLECRDVSPKSISHFENAVWSVKTYCHLSSNNSRKTYHSSPVKARNGVSSWVQSLVNVLLCSCWWLSDTVLCSTAIYR